MNDHDRLTAPARSNDTLKAWGWVTTLLFAPVGVIIAIVLLARGERRSGGWMLAVCLLWIIIEIILASAGSP